MPYPIATTPWIGSNPNPAYSGVFIPTIWSKKLIEKFYPTTVLTAISNTKYEGEIKNFGDKINIRTKPTITINDYQIHQVLNVQRPSSPMISMTIDKGKYFFVAIDDIFRVQADINLVNEWATDAAEQFKIVIDTDVLTSLMGAGNYATGNVGNTAGVISGVCPLGVTGTPLTLVNDNPSTGQTTVIDLLTRLGQVLDEQNVPQTDRWVILPAWVKQLIVRSELRDASFSGDGVSSLRNGRMGVINGFTLYQSNLLPHGVPAGLAAAEWAIFAGHKNGLTFASQFTKTETLRAESSFSDLMRGLQVYGFKTLDPTCLTMAIVKPA